MDLAIAQKLAVALAIGFVIGAERGFATRELPPGHRTAGVRTFALVGLFGGVAALLAQGLGPGVIAVGFLGVLALDVASYFVSAREAAEVGFTSEVALLLSYALGALAGSGVMAEAVAAAVVVTAILGFKRELHLGIEWLDRREVTATLQLLLIAAVAIPLLPDRGMGPLAALNPRRIGLLVLLLAGLSYAGWFAVRLAGERAGLLLTAALGGMASSTAVTLAYSRRARVARAQASLLGAGICLACAIMAVRLALVVGLIAPALGARIALPLAALAGIPALAAVRSARAASGSGTKKAELLLRNPLELEAALGLAALLAALGLAVRAAETWLGPAGVYAVAALSGIADVDALGLSVAQAANVRLDLDVAALAVTIAAAVNTAVKAGLAAGLGGRELARACVPALLGGLAVALVLKLVF